MSAPAPLPPTVKGWCPGALRPMETGDGLLVRVRITGGVVAPKTLAALARLARVHGNGLLDLSQRANLQIRGVRPETLDLLVADLDVLGLLDADPAVEAVRNVIGSPLAGLDPSATVDGGALVRALEAGLAASPDLHDLPDKFGFVVDDGGRIPLDPVSVDVRLVGTAEGVHVALGGDGADAAPAALVPERDAAATALALARAFLRLRQGSCARRMRSLVRAVGVEAIRAAAGQTGPAPERLPARVRGLDAFLGLQNRPSGESRDPVRGAADFHDRHPGESRDDGREGPHERVDRSPRDDDPHDRAFGFLGVAAPFGRFTAGQLDAVAAFAPLPVRLTPFRAILLPGAGEDALAALAAAGLIVDAADPRLAVAACPGRPACPSGQADARGAAEALAPLLAGRAAVGLHVSGCAKGCARPAETAVTLTGRDGRFDLVRDGRADGEPVARGLDLAAAREHVARLLSGKDAS